MSLKQRDGVELNCLRIGHTHYTHTHLMEKEPPRICQIYATILLQSKIENLILSENVDKQ